MARRAVSEALAAGVDRTALTDAVASAWIDIRAQVWPNADAPKAPLPRA